MGKTASLNRIPKLLLTVGLLFMLAWASTTIIRLYLIARSFQTSLGVFEVLTQNEVSEIDLDESEQLILTVRDDISELESILGPLLPIGKLFKWLPKVGPLLAEGPELMRLADAGSLTGLHAFYALRPTVEYIQENEGGGLADIPAILTLLQDGRPNLESALQSFKEVEYSVESIDSKGFPTALRSPFERITEELPLARSGLTWAMVLPDVMGLTERRAYLILAQNSDELRPAGGFISGVGLLRIQEGQIESVAFENPYDVDDWRHKPYGQPPQPFQDFMGMDIFLFRDSNFWPDFPTSAEMVMEFYTYGKGENLDGVIAVDNQFLQTLLGVTGPIYIPDLDQTITENNVIDELRVAWGPKGDQEDWIDQRKAFMGPLANAFRSKIETDLFSLDLLRLARDVQVSVNQGHFQTYFRMPLISTALNRAGWDGQQYPPSTQDFLQVVDTNMGFNKVNAVVERRVRYAVSLSDTGGGTAELQIEYSHNGNLVDPHCLQRTFYSREIQYSDLFNYCYWNYLRIYAPRGSSLLQSSDHPLPAEQLLSGKEWNGQATASPTEHVDLATFNTFILLQPEHTVTASFTYKLPPLIQINEDGHSRYSLLVKKQAGLREYGLEVIVRIPEGASLIEAVPDPVTISGHELTFTMVATEDLSVLVVYD